MPPLMREYQIDVIDRARNRVKSGLRRGIIQGETGSGKGVCLAYLAKCAWERGSRCLVIADRRRLVKQLSGTLGEFGVPFGVIMSGSTGGTREPVICASRDTFHSWCQNDGLGRPEFDVILVDECVAGETMIQTDVGEIRIDQVKELGAKSVVSWNGAEVVVQPITEFMPKGVRKVVRVVTESGRTIRCTEEHLLRTERAWEMAGFIWHGCDLLCVRDGVSVMEKVVDSFEDGECEVYDITVEGTHCFFANGILAHNCHKTMGATYLDILDRYPNAVTCGFTATPARNDGKSLGDFYQWIECTVPASKLIEDKFLIKPEVYAPMEVAKQRRDGKKTRGLAGDPVAHWQRHADGLPTIAFARKVSESLALRDRFVAAGIAAEHIDASVSDDPGDDGVSDRDRFYQRLADGTTKILCSVGLLIEGVDIPEASCVILWSKFGSLIQLRQAAGRIMRPCDRIGKSRAVVLDHSGACGVHGCPGEDLPWSLDMDSSIGQRRKKNLKDGKTKPTVMCRGCGCVYEYQPACPSCGMTTSSRKSPKFGEAEDVNEDAVLTRFDQEQRDQRKRESRQRTWWRCIAVAKKRGLTAGAAAGMFSREVKVPPWEAGVSPCPSGSEWKRPAIEVFA